MAVSFFAQDVDLPDLEYEAVTEWLCGVIESYSKSAGRVSIIFCTDNYILTINKQFLNHDYYTDIITFNYSSRYTISGDLFISVETVKSNAPDFSSEFKIELLRVMVHGVLHLLGLDDKTGEESKIIRQAENYWLKKFIG